MGTMIISKEILEGAAERAQKIRYEFLKDLESACKAIEKGMGTDDDPYLADPELREKILDRVRMLQKARD